MAISFVTRLIAAALSVAAALLGMPTNAGTPVNGLPSCVYVPGETAITGKPPIYLSVDAQGNVYTFTGSIITLGGGASYAYVTTLELQGLCEQGFPVALWGADGYPARPAPYVVVNEFVNRTIGSSANFVLIAKEAESSFIQRGGAGRGWSLTPYQLRVPRVADDLVPVHRFIGTDNTDPETLTHFFTADSAEYLLWQSKVTSSDSSPGWKYEGVAFWAPRAYSGPSGYTCSSPALVPVQRVAIPTAATAGKVQMKYRYVTNRSLMTSMGTRGAVVETASFCALADS